MASIEAQIAHVWRRLGFGPGPGDIDAGLALGPQNLIIDLCARTPTTLVEWAWPEWQPGDAWEQWEEYGRFQDRIIEQFVRSPNPLQERISWILMGLLVISQTDQLHYPDFKKYTNLLKQHALGSYHTVLREVTVGSGMQWYLNGFENSVGHANENLARELMELFALGISDPVTGLPNYSELDVKEMARALTGYQYNWTTGEADFNASRWDDGDKTFLGAPRGAATIDQVMQAIDQQPSYRRFIAQRFYRQIVGLQPEPAVIDALAAAFGPGCNLRNLVTAIAQRPEFLSDAAIRSRVKCPMELVAATLRALDLHELRDFNFAYSMSFLGQHLFNAPNVNGWPQGKDWLHAGQAIHWSTHAREMSLRDDGEADVPALRRSSTVRDLHAAGGALTGEGRAARALAALGLYDVAPATASAMATFATGSWSHARAAGLLCLGLNSPEFYLQ